MNSEGKLFRDGLRRLWKAPVPWRRHFWIIVVVGFLCRAADFDEKEYLGTQELAWVCKRLPQASAFCQSDCPGTDDAAGAGAFEPASLGDRRFWLTMLKTEASKMPIKR